MSGEIQKSSWFWRNLRILMTILAGAPLGALLLFVALAWSDCLSPPVPLESVSAAHLSTSTPEWQLAARQLVAEESARAETRLRDHFTWLIGLVGVTVTVIIAGFTFTLARREERSERELNEILGKCQEKHKEIEVLCKDSQEKHEDISKMAAPTYDKQEKKQSASQKDEVQRIAGSGDPEAAERVQPKPPVLEDAAPTPEETTEQTSFTGETILSDAPSEIMLQERTDSIDVLRKSANAGDAGAQFNLAIMYYSGNGVKQDYVEAAKWYRKAAEAGNAKAQVSLGLLLQYGDGVEIDITEAVKWYRKAAEEGNHISQWLLGEVYLGGAGVTRDLIQCARWFQKAADAGYAPAALKISRCYLDGEGVPSDTALAYAYLSFYRMAEGGDDDVKELLKHMEDELTAEQRKQAQNKVKELFEKARKLREES